MTQKRWNKIFFDPNFLTLNYFSDPNFCNDPKTLTKNFSLTQTFWPKITGDSKFYYHPNILTQKFRVKRLRPVFCVSAGSKICNSEYLNIILDSGALSIITISTRATSSFSFIIDYIITNDHKHNFKPVCYTRRYDRPLSFLMFQTKFMRQKAKKRSNRSFITETNPNSILKVFAMMFNRNFLTILLKCLT